MATGNISPEDLNNVMGSSETLGGGLKGAAAGAFTLAEEAAGLTGVLSELGSTLDFVTRNPLLSFTFFERIGRSLQKDIIENLRTSRNLTEDQVRSWNRWGTAINITSSAILSFATKVAYLQTQLRHASIEATKFFNMGAMPYGSAFDSQLQLTKNQAMSTLLLSSEFGKAQTQVTQGMGRLITPQLISGRFNMLRPQAQVAYDNYIKRLTLYSRAFPDANIPELSKWLYNEYGGHGMSTFGATEAAISLATRAGKGGFVSTASGGENINALQSLMRDYKSRNLTPEAAFQAAQMTLLGLGQVRGKGGETLSLQNILKLGGMYQGRTGEQEILANALGVKTGDRQKFLGAEGPLNWIIELQRWSKEKGLGGKPGSAVQDIVTQSLGSKFGASFKDLIMLANLPDISSKTEDIKGLVETFSKLNSKEFDQIRKSLDGLGDTFAQKLYDMEKKAQNLPDIFSGLIDWISTSFTGLSESSGIPPWVTQGVVAGAAGAASFRGGKRVLNTLGTKIGTRLPGLMSGKLSPGVSGLNKMDDIDVKLRLGESVSDAELSSAIKEATKGATTKQGALSKLFKSAKGPAALIAATAFLSAATGRRGREISDDVGSTLLFSGAAKAFGNVGAMLLTPTELGGGPTSSEKLNMELMDVGNKIRTGNVSYTPDYLKDLETRYINQLKVEKKELPDWAKDEEEGKGKGKGTLNVIFSTDSGTDLGEVMVKTGETAFINMHLGTILNSFGSK